MIFLLIGVATYAAIATIALACLWFEYAYWFEEAEQSQTENIRLADRIGDLREALAEADTELRRWRDRYSIETERVA